MWWSRKGFRWRCNTGNRGSSTLSLTWSLYGRWVVNARPGRFTPEKETRYPFYRRLGGLQDLSGRAQKISSPPAFLILLYSVLHPYLFLCLDYPAFCLGVFTYTTHNSNIHAPDGIRTRNPSRRASTDLRPRPRDHRIVRSAASRYTDWAIAAHMSILHSSRIKLGASAVFLNVMKWKRLKAICWVCIVHSVLVVLLTKLGAP